MHGTCNLILSIPQYLFDPKWTMFLNILWYLCADSLIAYKGALLQASGIFILSFLNMVYKDGRPFWDSTEITSFNHCDFSFTSPCQQSFNALFFCCYKYYMSRYKYAGQTNSIVDWLLIALIFFINAAVYFAGILNGVFYIYQSVMGSLIAFVYLVIVISFDNEIHRYCEQTGFILKSSRLRKFGLMFTCLMCFTFYILYYSCVLSVWQQPAIWIYNASLNANDSKCTVIFNQRANNKLGTTQTFYQTSIIFFIIGMAFGQPFSLSYVRPLLWVHSEVWRKVIRTVLGIAICIGISYGFYFLAINSSNMTTKYFWIFLLPNIIVSFFIFGIYPIICNWIGLVIPRAKF
jgi:hypothetical protein